LYRRYSAFTAIKYRTLPLQVSHADGLEQTTAFPLQTLHMIIAKQPNHCLSK